MRFIPTYVGHTSCEDIVEAVKPVHPHIRGAYRFNPVLSLNRRGSSPHTWGIRIGQNARDLSNRFIPTYVGHTSMIPRPFPTLAVHPHIRGAYVRRAGSGAVQRGSSPHTWGIPPQHICYCDTCAVHPHIRGAYGVGYPVRRGNVAVHPHIRGAYGSQGRLLCRDAVHPHIRGAYIQGFLGDAQNGGSSPHTWGILACAALAVQNGRFIPTYVGHTHRTESPPLFIFGSSPHTWGILL